MIASFQLAPDGHEMGWCMPIVPENYDGVYPHRRMAGP